MRNQTCLSTPLQSRVELQGKDTNCLYTKPYSLEETTMLTVYLLWIDSKKKNGHKRILLTLSLSNTGSAFNYILKCYFGTITRLKLNLNKILFLFYFYSLMIFSKHYCFI